MSKVRIDGEAEIPKHKWYEVLDKLSRVDDLLELLVKQADLANRYLERLAGGGVIEVPEPRPIVIRRERANRYAIFEIDLSEARQYEQLGLKEKGIVATGMSVIRVDSPFYFRINDKSFDLIEASVGMELSDFEIQEVYITNSAGAGYGKIWFEWRE